MQGLNLGRNWMLAVPLGTWKNHMASQDGWFTDKTGDQLYKVINNHWTMYSLILLRRRTKTFHIQPRDTKRKDVPLILHRAMVYEHSHSITLTGQGPIETQLTNNKYTKTTHFETQWECEYMIEGTTDNLRADTGGLV